MRTWFFILLLCGTVQAKKWTHRDDLKQAEPAFGPVDGLNCEAQCPGPYWQCNTEIHIPGTNSWTWSCRYPRNEKDLAKFIAWNQKAERDSEQMWKDLEAQRKFSALMGDTDFLTAKARFRRILK